LQRDQYINKSIEKDKVRYANTLSFCGRILFLSSASNLIEPVFETKHLHIFPGSKLLFILYYFNKI